MTDPRVVDITPNFVYTEPVELVARFIDQLARAWAMPEGNIRTETILDVVNGHSNPGIGVMGARERMREILTQDIELQIANKTFPLPKRTW